MICGRHRRVVGFIVHNQIGHDNNGVNNGVRCFVVGCLVQVLSSEIIMKYIVNM